MSGGVIVASVLVTVAMLSPYLQRIAESSRFFMIDWRIIRPAVQGWQLNYDVHGFYNPPWSALLLLPLGGFPLHVGGAVIIVLTLLAMILSIPRDQNRWLYALMLILAICSYRVLRLVADSNFEGMILLGLLLAIIAYKRQWVWAMVFASLLMTIKPQTVLLVLMLLGGYMVVAWPWRTTLKFVMSISVIVLLSMVLCGREWLGSMDDMLYIEFSYNASLWRLDDHLNISPAIPLIIGLVVVLISLVLVIKDHRTLNRYKVGLLICVSALITPYSTGNVLVLLTALVLVKLMQDRLWVGVLLFVLMNISWIEPNNTHWTYSGVVVTALVLVVWLAIVLNRDLWWRLPASQSPKDIFMG